MIAAAREVSEPTAAQDRPHAARTSARTLSSRHLLRVQRLHARAVLVVMSCGVLAATALAITGHTPRLPEWAVFSGMTLLVGLGSSAGYHRHFTHRSFKAKQPLRVALAILGSMAMQGSVIFWVALHRRHHENADAKGDPHSPYYREDGERHATGAEGLWHSYIGWTLKHELPNPAHYAKDLLRDRPLCWVNGTYFFWVAAGFLLPGAVLGLWQRSMLGFASGVVWGGMLRVLFWHHVIWYITSLAHVWGTRDYRSSDQSRNNVWLALPTLGESWHNNHHAFPTAGVLHFRWYQLDLVGAVIATFESLGWTWDVGRPTTEELARKQLPRGTRR